jgi:hypothetical protein
MFLCTLEVNLIETPAQYQSSHVPGATATKLGRRLMAVRGVGPAQS